MIKKIYSGIYFLTIILILAGCDNKNKTAVTYSNGSDDVTPPVITILGDNPVDLTLGAVYVDEGASAEDAVDGTLPVTNTGSVDTSVVGIYQITYTATDSSGNEATEVRIINISTLVDSTSPELAATAPATNVEITDIRQPLVFSAVDSGSGIHASSIEVTINGNDRSSLAVYQNDEITVTPDEANYWQAGVLVVGIEVKDNRGNQTNKDFSFTVQPATAALPKASVTSGFAPLQVQFNPFNTTSNAIVLYEWDFDNDGTFDISETVGRNQSFTFSTPGTHIVTLQITDAEGNETTGTVEIDVINQAPQVSASADPSNGSLPLTVNFSAVAQDNEGVASYEWDFEGDGTFDSTGPSASHTYTSIGRFQPTLRVKDSLGTEALYRFDNIEVLVNPEDYPTVTLLTNSSNGNAPLTVSFNASASAVGTRTITKWEWDFDGDGTYDETTAVQNISHTYTQAGSFYARVKVTDSDNQSSEDVVKIASNAVVNLALSTDTIDTGAAETVTITTVLGADSQASIIIENSFGTLIRTLVPKGARAAGSYDDEWDGKNDSGNLVAEGEYRAILTYEVGGEEQRLDLATTTGGSSYSPSRTRIPNSFQPFANNPLVFDFTINEAAEITAFMGNFQFGAGERLMTFMQRRPMGKGTHRITWNGEDNSGKLIELPVGETFIIGMFAYRFPDNGIYVRSGAHISNVARSPSLLVPDSVDKPITKLSFDLSNAADIQLAVHNAETGKLVASFSFNDLPAGSNEVTWDGRNNEGIYVEPGKYRLGVTAIDSNGYQSLTQYAVQQVYY